METPVIETKNLNYDYPYGTHAVRDINIKIKKGEKVAFIGSNGAGKATLFLQFNGILKPVSGKINISGEKMEYKKEVLTRIRQEVGIDFQNHHDQLFDSTVVEDVAFGHMNLVLSKEEVKKKS